MPQSATPTMNPEYSTGLWSGILATLLTIAKVSELSVLNLCEINHGCFLVIFAK